MLRQNHTYDEIPTPTGLITVQQKKTLKMYNYKLSDNTQCQSRESMHSEVDMNEMHMECVKSVTFMLHSPQNPYVIIASEYGSKNMAHRYVSSISYLAINPVLPSASRVFQVVATGDLQTLCEMLHNREASLRDTDQDGSSLLFVSTNLTITHIFQMS